MSSSCFAYGCNTGYKKALQRNKELRIRNPSLFSAPKDVELLNIWRIALARKDKKFSHPHKVCELHFEEDCIIREYRTRLADGTDFILERDKPLLKPGSIPTKFPNLPEYFSNRKIGMKNKSPIERKTPTKRKTFSKSEPLIERKAPTQENNNTLPFQDQKPAADSNNNYNLLSFHLFTTAEKPNKFWTISHNEENLLCIKLDANLYCDRHVVVKKDFSVKIFLRNKEIKVIGNSTIDNVQALSSLLKSVDKLVI